MTAKLHKASERFSETTIDNEIVVMQLDTGVFFSLKGTAWRIWELLDGTRDRAALLAALQTDYPDSASTIEQDLDQFLAELASAQLLLDQAAG
jgi:pyrroloquinoline quinone biosynthesis protein D